MPARVPGRQAARRRGRFDDGFSYAAQAVEVSVDTDLGTVTVDKVWSAIDCGFAINPMSVEGQVQGAIWDRAPPWDRRDLRGINRLRERVADKARSGLARLSALADDHRIAGRPVDVGFGQPAGASPPRRRARA
ncbi:molybdopterin-dependent oxidoreductase [Azoarcus sp. PA01]|nr:molybdopterin-dependent oxidoreductase [Azoarcus sp. PA01]